MDQRDAQWRGAPETRMDELAALYRIAALGTAQGDTGLVVNEILRIVEELVACERPLLFLYDSLHEEVTLHTSYGEDLMRLPLADCGPIRRVLLNQIGEVSNEIAADEEDRGTLIAEIGIRQYVAAPLVAGQDDFGVIAAINSCRGAFTEGDLQLLTILADRAALTLENSQLFSRLHRQVQELEGLQRISKLLSSTDDRAQVIGEALRIVQDLIASEKTVVLLYEEASNELVAQSPVVGLDDETLARLRIPLSEPSLGGTVFRTNTPLASNDPRDAWVNPRFRQLLDIETLLAVPLSTGPRPIGIMKAVNAKKGYFDDDDMRFLALLGGRVASVLEASFVRERERALMRRLRETDRTKSEFVSMLAHELRGPMTTVMGFGHTLEQSWNELPEDKRRHILRIMTKEIGRLSRMVTDLLDVSRMEAGTLRYDLAPVSLNDLVSGLLAVHESFHSEHEIVAELPDDLPPVFADDDRISQVLINLITNSIRYSPPGTPVTIGATVVDDGPGPMVRVHVSDRGIGIAPDDQERVFTKFAMLPKPGWVKKGTGLGLFITKTIVEAHGGRLWLESKPGQGTTFYFTLRIAEEQAA